METYKKCDFNKSVLSKLKAGHCILIQCDKPEEFASVRQTCYNAPERMPGAMGKIARYTTSVDKENMLVMIKAEKKVGKSKETTKRILV